ncbi:DUF4300 family protein [Dolosicoccus paucivorans]|uniref:DUF4300 family protein n=1 Tax=Dolosicoccus paucivorans TaxID=84521 RepID=UPI0008903BFB|nr:DUF4300 family protein [Dolosicoccus paucivorans]SDI53371.1 protein of unknown function [Dolosicoccus paucivorans]
MRKLLAAFLLTSLLAGCGAPSGETVQEAPVSQESETSTILLSNMSDQETFDEVADTLKKVLHSDSVDRFMEYVKEYNDTMAKANLHEGFKFIAQPEYDEVVLDDLWKTRHDDFIGTNCRINAYLLLKQDIQIDAPQGDDEILVMDLDADKQGEIFSEEELEAFKTLFSATETKPSVDPAVHGKIMEEFWKDMTFNDNARLISVVIHDDLDGDQLFVGHSGVLVPDEEGYLFVEKLSFLEPYQAIKFKTVEDCYEYLYTKYEHYSDETTSKPFIMNNGKFVELDEYRHDLEKE